MRNELLFKIYDKYQKSFYFYHEKKLLENIASLKKDYPDFTILYSMKTNPFPLICKTALEQGCKIDVASYNEVLQALKLGYKPKDIYFSAPAKTNKIIEDSIDKCIIIADSLNDINRISKIASQKNCLVNIGIRINPNFSINSIEGKPSKFGIDYEQLLAILTNLEAQTNLKVSGFHIHLQSQITNTNLLVNYYYNVFHIVDDLIKRFDLKLDFLNCGSGIPTSYNKATQINYNLVKKQITKFRIEFSYLNDLELMIESGRYLVGNIGFYISPVVDIKKSYGKNFFLIKDGMNGFLKPALIHLIKNYSNDLDIGYEPLYTAEDLFHAKVLKRRGNGEIVNASIVGPLCSSGDILIKNQDMLQAELNDLVIINNAGSYAYTLSVTNFSYHEEVLQVYYTTNNKLYVLKSTQNNSYKIA